MPDKKTQQDIEAVLEKGIDPKAAARVADEAERMGNTDSADWVRTHLRDYFAEVLDGAWRKFLDTYGRKKP